MIIRKQEWSYYWKLPFPESVNQPYSAKHSMLKALTVTSSGIMDSLIIPLVITLVKTFLKVQSYGFLPLHMASTCPARVSLFNKSCGFSSSLCRRAIAFARTGGLIQTRQLSFMFVISQ